MIPEEATAAISPRGKSRLQSPTAPRVRPLLSNDDFLERAQSRAAAAAAARRKSTSTAADAPPVPSDLLCHGQIMELFQNCIRLASENKINQKNTWELSLIDHLMQIIHVEDDTETNFQKASCTLEAGVKIYSTRVDSVHSAAYKVLGGMNRAGREDAKEDDVAEGDDDETDPKEVPRKGLERKVSPLQTLEASFESLNIKKFDVAFTVDPLYHQTSAQFDEGGAKGLLLNNLGVYGGCRVLFDSFEVPERCILCQQQNDTQELIDLSFAKDTIEQMTVSLSEQTEISPTLTKIMNKLDDDNHRPSTIISAPDPVFQDNISGNDNSCFTDLEGAGDCSSWIPDSGNHTSPIDSSSFNVDQSFNLYEDDAVDDTFHEGVVDEKSDGFERVAGFLSMGLGLTSTSNAWAGPEHWKYRKAKGTEKVPAPANEPELATKKAKNRKQGLRDIEFTNSIKKSFSSLFAPPKNPKSLLLSANRPPCSVRLPEDCHYKPESLVKLFILPDVLCIGKKGKNPSYKSRPEDCNSVLSASWDHESMDENFDDGNNFNDIDDSCTLVDQPRQVAKVDIQYDKVSKQVDVHVLKEILWSQIQGFFGKSEKEAQVTVSLRKILCEFPESCSAASTRDSLTMHLFFICLLHLANEHSLKLLGRPDLDDIDIFVPDAVSS